MKTAQLRILKVECVDKIHALQVRRKAKEKTIQRRTNNAMFEADEKGFYRKMESAEMTGEAPTIDAAYQFWNGIWGTEIELNEEEKWMQEVEMEIERHVTKSTHP